MKKKKLRKIPSGEENMKREIALLQKLSKTPHPNVIELFDVECKPEKEKTYLFMTFCCCSLQVGVAFRERLNQEILVLDWLITSHKT